MGDEFYRKVCIMYSTLMKCWKCVIFQSEFHVKQIIYFLPLNLKSQ
jgi:hypothetical protein